MEFLLSTSSPFVIALIGIAVGYFFKRVVLGILTIVILPFVLCAFFPLMAETGHSMGDLAYVVVIFLGLAFLVPMWVTHVFVICKPASGWLQWVKERTLNTKK